MNAKPCRSGSFIAVIFGALCLAAFQVRAQAPVQSAAATGSQTAPASTPWQITETGANHRVWQRTTYETGPKGKVFPHVHKYTELATGMYYKDANNQWAESKEVIEPYSTGAIAQQGPYQVIFANNLNSAGAIDQQTLDGKRLRSNILGLAYYDSASGQSLVIAEIQDSQGELISANQVLYPNAFTGVKADVRYTYKKGGFEQDVILREQPPAPESLGLNSSTTEIEVLTEFIDPPPASVKEHKLAGTSLPDDDINWGLMRIGRGKTFDLGEAPKRHPRVSVRRQYETVNGRQILTEGVPLPNIQPQLSGLPLQSGAEYKKLPALAVKKLALPKTPASSAALTKPMKMAASAPASKGYVLDYIELNIDQINYTFQGDTTYYISGNVNIAGLVTLEGGTVLKIPEDNSSSVDCSSNVICQTGAYRPAVFTSINDDSVGEIISGSSGSPNTGISSYLSLEVSVSPLKNIRMLYGDEAIDYFDASPIEISDSQFLYANGMGGDVLDCNNDGTGTEATFNNVLFSQCAGVIYNENGNLSVVELNNVTADQLGEVVISQGGP